MTIPTVGPIDEGIEMSQSTGEREDFG